MRPRHDPAGMVSSRVAAHLNRYPPHGPGRVLDVGAGNGLYTRRLHVDHPELAVVAMDISPGILREVPRPTLVADAARLPFADRCLEVVLAMHMLYHLVDPDAGIAELARVLVPGGLAVISTNHSRDKQELDQLWQAAARDVLGTPDVPRRISLSSRFPLEVVVDRLRQRFEDVETIDLVGTIEVPTPGPIIAHLASYQAWAEQTGVPFQAIIDRTAHRAADHIDKHGGYAITSHAGIVVGIRPRD
ncbi:MAG: class I SAM-dependent methyltransferase [Actinomycetales bacterium]|nr:class I SAM-dependent methyltransferase [Actinomycetales bacterium]